MIKLMLFLHIFGFVMWMGGGYAIMTASIAAKREERGALGPLVRIQAAIVKAVIGPGAGITVVTGLILTFKIFGGVSAPSVWLMVMQGTGLLAGILTLAITVPTAARVSHMDPQVEGPAFDALRGRLRVVGMVSGLLGLVALIAGTLTRFPG